MIQKNPMITKLVAMSGAVLLAGAMATQASDKADYTAMSPEELAEYLIYEAGGFNIAQEVQEGGTAGERMVQDELQKACSVIGGEKPDAATLAAVSNAARDTITYPEGGIKLGDWKKGADLAWSGFGFRIGHNFDDHETREPGGNCYNCHMLAPEREIASGTVGPSLTGFGNTRGTGEATLKYVYDIIYNAHAYFPCTYMPRFGHKNLLTEEQIADLMAYVLDPESPVNQ
jgi:L-cysteine S-thiosulfotransferase